MKTTLKVVFAVLALLLGGMSADAATKKKKPLQKAGKAAAPASSSLKVPGETFIYIDGETVGNWELGKDEHSTISAAVEPGVGKNSNALALKYNMGANGLWVSACLEGPFELSDAGGVAFAYQGDGVMNSLEVKLEMATEETFGKVFLAATKERGWVVARVPLSDFKYFWGGSSQNLDLSSMEVKKVCFAVSKKPNDSGKAGKLLVSDVSKTPK